MTASTKNNRTIVDRIQEVILWMNDHTRDVNSGSVSVSHDELCKMGQSLVVCHATLKTQEELAQRFDSYVQAQRSIYAKYNLI